MEPEPPGAAFFTLEPESAPGPMPPGAGAAQKSGGSATRIPTLKVRLHEEFLNETLSVRSNMDKIIKGLFKN